MLLYYLNSTYKYNEYTRHTIKINYKLISSVQTTGLDYARKALPGIGANKLVLQVGQNYGLGPFYYY